MNFCQKTYLYFFSFLKYEMAQVVESLPHGGKNLPISHSIPWLLMTWRRKEPGHQQPCYWPNILVCSGLSTRFTVDYIVSVKVRSHMRGRRRAENWLQHKSLHVLTHARSPSGGGAGAKSAPQEMGPTLNLPRPLRNCALQTIIVLKNCQNPPASAPQPPRACVNVALVSQDLFINNGRMIHLLMNLIPYQPVK